MTLGTKTRVVILLPAPLAVLGCDDDCACPEEPIVSSISVFDPFDVFALAAEDAQVPSELPAGPAHDRTAVGGFLAEQIRIPGRLAVRSQWRVGSY